MKTIPLLLLLAVQAAAQEAALSPAAAPSNAQAPAASLVVPTGTRVPLLLINSISTRNAAEGDQVYLETAFPIVVSQRIVIPPGSYVKGTITQIKRPGRVKGRGEVYLRFDSLTLPNGVTRDFRGRVGAVDGSGAETLEKAEGKIIGDTAKGSDAGTIVSAGTTGAGIGSIAGVGSGRPGMGAAIGGGAGAAAGLIAVLLTHGPEVQLLRGTELDMVLDRPLTFAADELVFEGPQFRSSVGGAGASSRDRERTRLPGLGDRVGYPRPF